jgi:hypothetical protein
MNGPSQTALKYWDRVLSLWVMLVQNASMGCRH